MPPGILDDRPRFQNGSGVERVCYVEVQRITIFAVAVV